MKNPILPEFQDFLVSRSLVPEKNVSFYAHWVSKSLMFSNRNEGLGHDLRGEWRDGALAGQIWRRFL